MPILTCSEFVFKCEYMYKYGVQVLEHSLTKCNEVLYLWVKEFYWLIHSGDQF